MKIGFIGCGNMACAMINGILKKELCGSRDIFVSDVSKKKLEEAKNKWGIKTTLDNISVAEDSDYIFVAVKPMYYEEVLKNIAPALSTEKVIISIAPGKTLDFMGDIIGIDGMPIIRTMPNTPAMVGEGITAVSPNGNVSEKMLETACEIMNSFGKTEVISETLMNSVVGLTGSSPAYVFMLIEAMADGAVLSGMPRDKAYTLAAQAVKGSAEMVLSTGKHPAELKDMVCSPGGTTIEAVRTLEERGFRSSIIEAMEACYEKTKSS